MAELELGEEEFVVVGEVLEVAVCAQDETGFVEGEGDAVDEGKEGDF